MGLRRYMEKSMKLTFTIKKKEKKLIVRETRDAIERRLIPKSYQ